MLNLVCVARCPFLPFVTVAATASGWALDRLHAIDAARSPHRGPLVLGPGLRPVATRYLAADAAHGDCLVRGAPPRRGARAARGPRAARHPRRRQAALRANAARSRLMMFSALLRGPLLLEVMPRSRAGRRPPCRCRRASGRRARASRRRGSAATSRRPPLRVERVEDLVELRSSS